MTGWHCRRIVEICNGAFGDVRAYWRNLLGCSHSASDCKQTAVLQDCRITHCRVLVSLSCSSPHPLRLRAHTDPQIYAKHNISKISSNISKMKNRNVSQLLKVAVKREITFTLFQVIAYICNNYINYFIQLSHIQFVF